MHAIFRWSRLLIVAALILCGTQFSYAATFDLTPVQVGDGPFQTVSIGGKNYTQVLNDGAGPANYIYYDVPASYTVSGQPVYIQVFYLEYGYGQVNVHYDSNYTSGTVIEQSYIVSEESYGKDCVNRKGAREAVFLLQKPKLSGRENNSTDLRLFSTLSGGRLTIEKAVLWTTPPPLYTANAAKPWLAAYSGTTRTDIDATTLDGKVLAGYQGWFNTPGDGAELGFRHWSRDRYHLFPHATGLGSGTINVEYWPEVLQYAANDVYQTTMTLTTTAPAYLYSPFKKGSVLEHFHWMRQYGIDGVFLSRFVSDTRDPAVFRHDNQVLNNVREGAHVEGRVWAIMYDVTDNLSNTADIINDWKFMCDQVKARDDSRYLHHAGKPVVMIWGYGFTDRNWTPAQATQVINFFKNDPVYGGAYVIGGVDPGWRTLTAGSRTDPAWSTVYRSFDAISPWDTGRYANLSQLASFQSNTWAPDLTELNSLNKGYVPVAFPGFSWDNLQNLAPGTSKIARLQGDFYWKQFYYMKSLGVKTVFVGMFDEVDEGTAIYKVNNVIPTQSYFLNYEGKPSDWYLKLTGSAGLMMRGTIPLSFTIPTSFPFPNPANVMGAGEWESYR